MRGKLFHIQNFWDFNLRVQFFSPHIAIIESFQVNNQNFGESVYSHVLIEIIHFLAFRTFVAAFFHFLWLDEGTQTFF